MSVVEFPSRPPASTAPDRLVSRVELARLLGCHVATVDRMVKAGCPSVRVGVRLRRFRLRAVDHWLEERAA